MQKWQRDRMRKRQQAGAPQNGGEQPPPLQPAYPGMEQPAESAPEQPTGMIESETQPESEPGPAPGERPVRSSRRRGRRGRGGKGKASPSVPMIDPGTATGEAAEVSIPEPAADESLTEPLADEADDTAEAEEAVDAAEAAPVAMAPAAAKVPAPAKGAVVLAIGMPGSGKSTWFKRREITPLSSDLMRHLLFDNVQEQRHQDLVFSTLRSLLRARLLAHMPWNYVDATNLSPKERRHWVRLAKDFGYEAHAVFFDVPLEVCMERNNRRHRVVPEDVMKRMAAKLRAPSFDEGFSKITVVRVKSKPVEPPANG